MPGVRGVGGILTNSRTCLAFPKGFSKVTEMRMLAWFTGTEALEGFTCSAEDAQAQVR